MDVELVTESDEGFMVHDNNADYTNFEGERCGICMDTVIDRGVLDCCQHWFCFTCIDNWATITNLCPLCQNAFQLITCVPVYDTVGNKTDENSYSRDDDDWCIEGQNNTLSFPSYYIDENAVVCLEGDGCKIRSRSVTLEADSVLDTSIACDGCDVWYHAFCVGFDPDGTYVNSWHCPRCLNNQMPRDYSDDVPVTMLGNQPGPDAGGGDSSGEASFLGKVSVSIADAGETAIVVSRVDENQGSLEPSGGLPILDSITNKNGDALVLSSVFDVAKPQEPASIVVSRKQISGSEKLGLLSSQNECFSLASPSPSHTADARTEDPSSGSALVESMANVLVDDQVHGMVLEKSSLQQVLPDDEIAPDKAEILVGGSMKPYEQVDIASANGVKRKNKDTRIPGVGVNRAEIEADIPLKKVKLKAREAKNRLVPSKDYSSGSDEDAESEKIGVSFDIMNIVQGSGHKRRKLAASTNSTSKEGENSVRLRVKKIMRRTGDDADASQLVQNLRKEIRDAVRNKSSKEIGENIFDPTLLAAFRAAVAGPVAEDSKKPPVDLKAKKALLQKGKVRENLTKKIYGVGGRRKRAWTRDCEVEFWKHRCEKVSRPEKVQTLKSVLDLLKNDTGNKEIKHDKDGEASSILSRLYLADTSIFPRKDDIRPISVLRNDGIPEKNKEQNLPQNLEKNPVKNEVSKTIVDTSTECTQPKKGVSGLKTESASAKSQNKHTERPSTSQLGSSKLSSQSETSGASNGKKSDMRKWALELLARKTATTNGPREKEEDSIMLKGNFPLLAQLPKDMRPVLAPTHHNKIPVSVRQAQLYRLAELFLRKANLPVISITAETELAVADAVNIEKEVANRSNSKLVYVNLCSQELSRRSDCVNLSREETAPTSPAPIDQPEEKNDTADTASHLEVDEALKLAGLSDTPPSSPCQPLEEYEDSGLLQHNNDDDELNVFEMDAQPELDIYGDFEYNLEDDDLIAANVVKTSNPPEEGSRMKLLFSTLNLEKSNGSPHISDLEGSACNKPVALSFGYDCPIETGSSNRESVENANQPQAKLPDEECAELSLAECEELYGPDKEPLVVKYPERATMQPCEVMDDKGTRNGNECNGINKADKESEPEKEGAHESASSHNHPHNAEQTHWKKKSSTASSDKQSDAYNFVSKKVEAYVKEHIRPLCKSGVITVEQYRWAVGKTTEKVMKFHSKDKNANFLIKEGEKVKKLAERYVETAQQTVTSQACQK
ncbi:OLC1v1030059C1 [Oldenlandia corymbosa var. corymbosa]|uniref:OLC1v1030059C1 n=1 Tax=Oldenlandia corymbosa var. corymbosa TaxID=529605 RepID=A0AAV1CH71_OLDCO|nr:OLC1v1030059C1 [Oldenlandia corymbosa var. corymbosa]